MEKLMTGAPFKRPYRFIIGVLIVSVNFCAMLPYIAPTIVMPDVMATFGLTDYTLVGLSISLQLAVAGLCFFIGTFISDKLGMLRTAQLSICSLFVGALICSLSPSIGVFFVGRAIAGLGQGLGVSLTPFLSTWFDGKERSMMITFNGMGSAIALAISSAVIAPLSQALGSWQAAIGVFTGITAVFAVGWLVLGRMSPEGEEQQRQIAAAQAAAGKQESSLSLALKETQFWKIMVFALMMMFADTARATFLPTYSKAVLGLSEGLANTATSLLSLAGLVGSLLGGVLVTRIWCRKPLVIFSHLAYFAAAMLLTFLPAGIGTEILTIALGFIYFIPVTAQSTLVIETAISKGKPQMISGGIAMSSGVGMLSTLLVSPAFTAIAGESNNMTLAFRVMCCLILIGVAAACTVKETGRKPEGT